LNSSLRDPDAILAHDHFVRSLARSLLHDAHRAEDLAQDTWLAAMRSEPGDRGSLRGWLAAIVRHLATKAARGESRSARRDAAAAKPEELPSVADVLEREALRRTVVDAVLALREPYRSTILLRYFEELPPRAIAKRLSIPVETVRTRVKRALDELRGRLDRERTGDRKAWCLALTQLAAPGPVLPFAVIPSLVRAALPGLSAMTLKLKLASAVTVLASLALLVWISVPDGGPFPPPGEPPALAAAADARREARTADVGPQRLRVEVPAPESSPATLPAREPADPFGSLLIKVVWGDDKSPAEGIGLRVQSEAEFGLFPLAEGTTGSDGTFRADRLPAELVSISIDRALRGREHVKVLAGEQNEVTVEIPAGLDVEGVVEDHLGSPVANAEIWLSSEMAATEFGGRPVGRAQPDGSFRFRSVDWSAFVGARARGFAPSGTTRLPLWQLAKEEGRRVRLRLVFPGRGGEAEGRVFDPSGLPVPGAAVLLGSGSRQKKTERGEWVRTAPPMPLLTDSAGRFHAEGLALGTTPIVVRAKDLVAWAGSIVVEADRPQVIEVRLEQGVTITGTVKDAAGRAQPGAEVWSGDRSLYSDFYLTPRTRTARDGSFRLGGVPAGEIRVHTWWGGEPYSEASAELAGAAGQTLACDLVLQPKKR
jgi:RNA polymerase sigma-70 factor (ECF subfamily)